MSGSDELANLRARVAELEAEVEFLTTPPDSTNAGHTARIKQVWVGTITDMLARDVPIEQIADQLLLYTNSAMWAVEREMERVAQLAEAIQTMAETNWWTTSDVAKYLKVGVPTVSGWRQRNQMPQPEVKHGRTYLWRPQTIIVWHATRPRAGKKEPTTSP